MCKQVFAFNCLQLLICHKTKLNNNNSIYEVF